MSKSVENVQILIEQLNHVIISPALVPIGFGFMKYHEFQLLPMQSHNIVTNIFLSNRSIIPQGNPFHHDLIEIE